MTSEARVVALDRPLAGRRRRPRCDLLDVVFGWADFAKLRRLVTGQCAAAGLTGSPLDDFVLAAGLSGRRSVNLELTMTGLST